MWENLCEVWEGGRVESTCCSLQDQTRGRQKDGEPSDAVRQTLPLHCTQYMDNASASA